MFTSLFISSVMTLSFNVAAEDLIATDQEALSKTMELMQDPAQREGYLQANPDARKADNMAKQLMGNNEQLEQIYKLAAEVFRNVATESKGDANDMMKQLGDASKDPEAFFNRLTPEQKEMVKKLGIHAKGRQNSADIINSMDQGSKPNR